MKKLYLVLGLILNFATLHAQAIKDPVQDFLELMSRKPDDELIKLIAPVNRSGGNEIFLTYSHNVNGKGGNVWTIYAPVDGGYQRLDNLITFRLEQFFVGKSKELGGLGLLTYVSGGGGTGTIVGFIFQGTDVKEVDITDIELAGKHKDLYEKYFVGDKHPKIEVTPADKLPPR